MTRFREGPVYYFPGKKDQHSEPLLLRLLRVRGKKKKNDVWLLTNVMDPKRLSLPTAARFYRWRWENEGQFRAYKRTLAKVKMVSRSVRLVHREAEGSLLALQLMLAQGVLRSSREWEEPPSRHAACARSCWRYGTRCTAG